jgi:hypothetical protein
MAVSFCEISSAMTKFEKMDPDSKQFLKVNRGVNDLLVCYQEICEETKKKKPLSNNPLIGHSGG